MAFMGKNKSVSRQQVVELLELLDSLSKSARREALQRFADLQKDIVTKMLLTILSEPDVDLSCLAAQALIQLDQQNIDLVVPYLHSSNSTLRWMICGLLSDSGDKRATEPLIYVLENDSEADIRMLAAFALGNIGDQKAIPALLRAQQNDKDTDFEGRQVSDVATDALKQIR